MSLYRYLLANSLTNEILAELPLTRVSYSFTFNEPGQFRAALPLQLPDPLASILRSTFFSADPALDLHAIYVERDHEIVWGGLVWGDQADYGAEDGMLQLSGEGWHSWLRKRVLTDTLTYTQVDQASIAADLIGWAQEEVFGGDAGIDLTQVEPTGRLRDRTYHAYERRNLGETLEDLAAVIDGFGFRYVSEWGDDGKIVTRFLVDYPPSRETALVFDLEANMIGARVATDRTQLATAVHGIGAGEGDLAIRSLNDDESLLGARLYLDATVTHTDVTERTTLEDHGAERLKRGARPIVIPELKVRADQHPMVGDYRVGDVVGAVGRVGWHSFTGSYRITEISVGVDDNGTEEVDLALAPEGVFNPAGAAVDRPIQPLSIGSGERFGTPTIETATVDPGIVFFDDFTEVHPTNRGLNPNWWFVHDRPVGNESYVNNEWQLYVPSQVSVENSLLVITCEHLGGEGPGSYLSGLVTTAGKVHIGPYGLRIEINLKAPGSDGATQGLWPSLFTLEQGSATYFGGLEPGFPGGAQGVPGWPTTGKSEVDIWEWPGFTAFGYHTNRHWSETPGGSNPVGGREVDTSPIDITDSFNTYSFVWTQDFMSWEFNGVEQHRILPSVSPPPSQPMFLIINFAIGGDFGGTVGPTTVFPSRYEIDWIRVRQLTPAVKVSTLVDAFDPPQAIWTATGTAGQVSTADSAVTVTTAPTYPGFRTTTGGYDLTGSSVYAEVSQVPNLGGGSTQAFLSLTDGHVEGQAPQAEVRIGYNGGQLVGEHQVGGGYIEVFSIVYSASAHRHWSISEAGGTISFATSPDAETWTIRGTVATGDIGFSVVGLDVEINSGHFDVEADPGVARFEGINVTSGTTTPPDPGEPGGKPDATNTGLTDPGALTPAGSNLITTGGVHANLEFTGTVEIRASNVTLRNCKFTGPASSEALIFMRTSFGAVDLVVEDCEIDGGGLGTDVAVGYGEYTLRRCDIHDVIDGPRAGGNILIEDCFIHDLTPGPGTHNDGIQSTGPASGITIRHTTITNPNSQTSAILIGADLGNISNVLVEDNWLDGGGFAIYAGHDPGFTLTGCIIRNNKFGRNSAFGIHSFSADSEIDFTGNTFEDNGEPIPDVHHP